MRPPFDERHYNGTYPPASDATMPLMIYIHPPGEPHRQVRELAYAMFPMGRGHINLVRVCIFGGKPCGG